VSTFTARGGAARRLPRSAWPAHGVVLALLLALLAPSSASARPAALLLQDQQQQGGSQAPGEKGKKGKKEKKPKSSGTDEDSLTPRPTGPLFSSNELLQVTITADFGDVFKGRDTLRPRVRPARLTVAGDDGAPRTVPVSLSTRGHFRLKPTTCPFAPLRVVFDTSGAGGTPFARQRALKLSTHCRTGNHELEQNVLREYLAYRIYNLMTDRSFRARLARVTYAEARDTSKRVTAYGFFIESERDLGRRIGARLLEARGGKFADFDPAQTDLLSVFEYMIGNTDFSIWALHNIRVYANVGTYFPVPYDFDWSGLVNATYAFPDPRLGINNVRERLYRGPCRTPEELAPTFARFNAQRDSVFALLRGLPDVDARHRKETEQYFTEFYQTISSPERWKRDVGHSCREGQ